jgi:beta-glucosidase
MDGGSGVKVTNSGTRAGDEIVQLYIRDMVSSVTRPVKELKDFARIGLQPGETKTVRFRITPDKLAFYKREMQRVVERAFSTSWSAQTLRIQRCSS